MHKSLKIVFFGLTFSLLPLFASAEVGSVVTPAVMTLSSVMKAMGSDLKKIAAQASDASKNASSAALADDFIAEVLKAKSFVPDKLAALPQADQQAQMVAYTKILDEAQNQGVALAADFRAGNNAAAVQLLKQLAGTRTTGHDQFK